MLTSHRIIMHLVASADDRHANEKGQQRRPSKPLSVQTVRAIRVLNLRADLSSADYHVHRNPPVLNPPPVERYEPSYFSANDCPSYDWYLMKLEPWILSWKFFAGVVVALALYAPLVIVPAMARL